MECDYIILLESCCLMSTSNKIVQNKKSGKTKAAGRGSSDVFQGDNKERHRNGNDNGKTNVKMKTSLSSSKSADTSKQVKTPRVVNGKCCFCPFNGDILNETIECSKCSESYHAVCRDKKGQLGISSICPKTFLPYFRSLSAHYGADKDRWGQFNFVCGNCNVNESTFHHSTPISHDVSIKNIAPLYHCTETQTTPKLSRSAECQTITSGNILELSLNSVDTNSPIDVCNAIDLTSSTLSFAQDELGNSTHSVIEQFPDIVNDFKTLTKLNEEVLVNIKSLQKLSKEQGIHFDNQITDLKNSLKSTIQPDKQAQNSLAQLQVDNQVFTNSQPSVNYNFDAEECKPFKELHTNILDDEHLKNLSDYLDQSNDFKTIKSQNGMSSRDVLYFGEFKYRYGAIQHEANKIPDIIQSVVDTITAKYPKTIVNSCLVTRYKNGNNTCPQHSDNEPFIAPWSDIFTMSVGRERSMQFQSVQGDTSSLKLPNNSLLAFSRSSQEFWKHEIPSDESTTVRYSLTFRQLAPFYTNSTLVVGDSNTEPLKFGVGRNTFGIWMPGCRVKAGRIKDIPGPDELEYPYRHVVIHCGINDLRNQNHLPIPVLMNSLEEKCLALTSKFPKMKIHLSMLLPTKDPGLNAMVSEFNRRIKTFSDNHATISIISHQNLADSTGKLSANLGRHSRNGIPAQFDTVHLGSKGISMFCMNIKSCIIKKKADHDNLNIKLDKSHNVTYPYWKPNPSYKQSTQPPVFQPNPWTGNHNENFPVQSFQPFNINCSHNGYQS